MKKIYLLFFFTFLVHFTVISQHYQHYVMWSKCVFQKKINDRWDIAAELHMRRQNDFTTEGINIFESSLAEAYRVAAIRKFKNWTVSFAPIVFHAAPLYAKTADFNRPIRWEIRPSWYVEWVKKLTKTWSVRSRLGYEYRLFQKTDHSWGDEQGRIRMRFQIRHEFNSHNMVYLSDEPMYNVIPNVPANGFSQNQFTLTYNHTFSPHFITEVGYMWNHRQRATLVEFDEEQVLQTNFIFRL